MLNGSVSMSVQAPEIAAALGMSRELFWCRVIIAAAHTPVPLIVTDSIGKSRYDKSASLKSRGTSDIPEEHDVACAPDSQTPEYSLD